jgi:hypothetical protein
MSTVCVNCAPDCWCPAPSAKLRPAAWHLLRFEAGCPDPDADAVAAVDAVTVAAVVAPEPAELELVAPELVAPAPAAVELAEFPDEQPTAPKVSTPAQTAIDIDA